MNLPNREDFHLLSFIYYLLTVSRLVGLFRRFILVFSHPALQAIVICEYCRSRGQNSIVEVYFKREQE
jgi:hypothetical protein